MPACATSTAGAGQGEGRRQGDGRRRAAAPSSSSGRQPHRETRGCTSACSGGRVARPPIYPVSPGAADAHETRSAALAGPAASGAATTTDYRRIMRKRCGCRRQRVCPHRTNASLRAGHTGAVAAVCGAPQREVTTLPRGRRQTAIRLRCPSTVPYALSSCPPTPHHRHRHRRHSAAPRRAH